MTISRNIRILTLVLVFMLFLQNCNSQENKSIFTEGNGKNSSSQDDINNSRQNAITRAVEKAKSAIVGINVTETYTVQYNDPFQEFLNDPYMQRFFRGFSQPRRKQYEVRELGSGFLISEDGYIVTNHHVAGNASKIVVTTTDGKKFDAEIIGADKTSDVALLKIKGNKFPYLRFANSDDVIIGEWAIAFGNPFGLFDLNAKPTVTVGVVSNTGIDFLQEDRVYKNMIQTDAAISSGNSGGPLVNSMGEVIGVNTIIFSTAQSGKGAGSIGIGWAIPVNRVKTIINSLTGGKKINRDYTIGMEVREMDEQIARYLKVNIKEGIVVVAVENRSPAEKAGIEPGDIILKINDKDILRDQDYLIAINDGIVGEIMKFLILRDDKKIEKQILLEQKVNRRGANY